MPLPGTIQECSSALRKAKQDIKLLVAASIERRDHERNRKLRELEEAGTPNDRKLAQQLRRIKKAEDLKNLFRKLKYVRSTGAREGVTRVEIPRHEGDDPKSCTDWIQVDIPTEVLRLLQERNRTHFGQAFGTPFTIPPLSTDLGFGGMTESGQQILDGKYDRSPHRASVQLLLQHLQHVEEVHQHNTRASITREEFEGKLKVWSESTTTSPSGLHLGHYKALIARHSYSTDQFDDELTPEFSAQRDELNAKQRELLDLQVTMMNYALRARVFLSSVANKSQHDPIQRQGQRAVTSNESDPHL